jgi:predicted amidophosphoribosyltransferase
MIGTYKHWCYPSAIIGCRQDISSLSWYEITFLRSQVTCPACLEQLRADKGICEACKLGAPEVVPVNLAPPHVCDPGLS